MSSSELPVDLGQDEQVPADEPRAATALRRLNEGIGRVEVGVLGLLILLLITSTVVDMLATMATWPDEVTRYSVFFVAMMGLALAAQRQGMFHMDLVTRLFPARLRSGLRIGTAVMVVVLCGLVIQYALRYREGSHAFTESYEVISVANAYLAAVIGFALVALHFALHAGIEVVYLARGKVPPDPPHGGH